MWPETGLGGWGVRATDAAALAAGQLLNLAVESLFRAPVQVLRACPDDSFVTRNTRNESLSASRRA
jgi:hypothetical protein